MSVLTEIKSDKLRNLIGNNISSKDVEVIFGRFYYVDGILFGYNERGKEYFITKKDIDSITKECNVSCEVVKTCFFLSTSITNFYKNIEDWSGITY